VYPCASDPVFAIVAVLGQTALLAQVVNGTTSATMTDPSVATIAGATVELKYIATQVVRSVTTNAQARYQAPELLVGRYDAAIMHGFQNSIQTGVQRLSVGNASDDAHASLL
jgi:hypothetical protein